MYDFFQKDSALYKEYDWEMAEFWGLWDFFLRLIREWLYELLEMWVIDRDIRDILGQEWYGEDMIEVWEGEIKMLQKLKKEEMIEKLDRKER